MAGKVFFSVSMSLDGFIAPDSPAGGAPWGSSGWNCQQWAFPLRFFRENLKLGEGGEEGRDNDIARETYERTGASVMGKRMFDAGEQASPEEPPFHTPIFVVTHQKRQPWERTGDHLPLRERRNRDRARPGPRGGRQPRRPHRGRRRNRSCST